DRDAVPASLVEGLERLELGLAMKMFLCPSLERRLMGLMRVSALVAQAEEADAQGLASGTPVVSTAGGKHSLLRSATIPGLPWGKGVGAAGPGAGVG
ncbi:unnamed protein product, partial [Discosporangium mesarthrocarpum]